jgi:hypothetical protein
MCLQITLGENHGTGHFYLAENRTFLLCVDNTAIWVIWVRTKTPHLLLLFLVRNEVEE